MRSSNAGRRIDDLGIAAVERVHREMQIDEPWTLREERGFTWWAAWIRQRVWADTAVRSGGETLWHVRARTPIFRDQPDEPATYARVNDWNELSPMGALAFDPDDGTISARTGAFLYAGVDPWLETMLLGAVGLQASLAWGGAEAAEGAGPRDTEPHPTAGRRRDPDEMLRVAASLPRQPSPMTASVLGSARSALASEGFEVPFPEDRELLLALLPTSDEERAMWGLRTVDHPMLGPGAAARLVLPRELTPKRGAWIANALNLAEAADWSGENRPHAFGAWRYEEGLLIRVARRTRQNAYGCPVGVSGRLEGLWRRVRRVPDPWLLPVTTDPDGVDRFTIPRFSGRLQDVGPPLNRQFAELYVSIAGSGTFDEAQFQAATFAYLDSVSAAGAAPDPYFNNFTVLGLPEPSRPVAFMGVWELALAIVHAWESAVPGRWVHKGSGYYFAAMRDIALGDIDRGWLYVHAAADEDRRRAGSPRPSSPAIWFATLDATAPNQAARSQVQDFEQVLIQLIDEYRKSGRGSLTLSDYRDRFTRYPQLEEPLMSLAHAVARLSRLATTSTIRIRSGSIAELLLSQAALEVCLVDEELLRLASGMPTANFARLAAWYAAKTGLPVTSTDLGVINSLFNTTFDVTMGEVLDGRPVTGLTSTLSAVERDLAAAYGVRNASAHGVSRPTAITNEFDRLVPRLFYGVFRVLEVLFP